MKTLLMALLLTVAASSSLRAADTTAASTNSIAIRPLDNYEQWREAIGADKGTDPATFSILPGFAIELVRSATKEEGSWISLALDPQGRAIISRETKGLLRFTLSTNRTEAMKVEPVNNTLEECRGLLFAHGALYANANKSKGLYRLRDTKGDDQFDEVTLLQQTRAGGHGRNDLALGPDSKIYQIAGDDVDFPPGTFKSTSPIVANLLPGEHLTRGHLIRCDADGKNWELVAGGLRNPYGIAFNEDGEAFTYDADAEHDMGAPWYRPTRIRHLVSGADFGWRRVTGTWPPYYPDHADEPPNTLDIGKGSPTSVMFGTRSKFPPLYQRALFVLDWTYGRIFAVHLAAKGASYEARAETFLRGRPLNVTDLDFGPDGALYFITGGRNTQSALYRVRYTGKPATDAAPSREDLVREESARRTRALRHELEKFHGRQDPLAIETAWPHLANSDAWIAHAARVALEHQPCESWQTRALEERSAATALPASMALARVGPDDVLPKIATRMNAFPLTSLDSAQQAVALRIYEICLQRTRDHSSLPTTQMLAAITPLLSIKTPDLARTVGSLLVTLRAPELPARLLAFYARAETQEDRLHFLFLLRNVREDWSESDRGKYFRALAQMESFVGGAGLPKFRQQIKDEALAALPADQRAPWAAMLATNQVEEVALPIPNRPLVHAWTVDDFSKSLGASGQSRDLSRGKRVYAEAACIRCHQFGREGRAFGPDLTDVASRFSRRDILDSILNPSLVVAESFRNVTVKTKSGEVVTGRLVMEGDYRLPVLRIGENPLSPEKFTEISKSDVASYAESAISPMPEGLLNSFTREEILDLLAYLEGEKVK